MWKPDTGSSSLLGCILGLHVHSGSHSTRCCCGHHLNSTKKPVHYYPHQTTWTPDTSRSFPLGCSLGLHGFSGTHSKRLAWSMLGGCCCCWCWSMTWSDAQTDSLHRGAAARSGCCGPGVPMRDRATVWSCGTLPRARGFINALYRPSVRAACFPGHSIHQKSSRSSMHLTAILICTDFFNQKRAFVSAVEDPSNTSARIL